MGPPFERHPTSAADIRATAERAAQAKNRLEAVMTALEGPGQDAADAVDGVIDGQIRGPVDKVQRDAMNAGAGTQVCKDAVELFANYVEIFDSGVADLNERWARAKAHDFYVAEDADDREEAIADARGIEASALRTEYGRVEAQLDAGAQNVATALSTAPWVATTMLKGFRENVAPVLANVRRNGPELVALGDSYSAGTGIGNYYTSGENNPFRSHDAYSWLLAEQYGLRVNHQATNGATTEDMIKNQLSALSDETAYVTLTAGGNDLEFSKIVEASLTGDATAQIEAKREEIRSGEFEQRLETLYGEIGRRAPNAKVVVGTYPHLFDGDAGLIDNPLLSTEEEKAIVAANDEMAAVIERVATKHGYEVAVVREAYEGHDTEAVGRRWLNPLMVRFDGQGEMRDGLLDFDSYHPNAEGHEGYAGEFDDYFAR